MSSSEMSDCNNNGGNKKLFEGQALLYKHLFSFFTPICLKLAVKLGIPTIIHNHGKSITLSELISALHLPPSKACFVPRLMRFLAHNGLFAIVRIHHDDNGEQEAEEKEGYVLTSASELLVEGSENCLSAMVKFIVQPTLVDGWIRMDEWIYGEEVSVFGTACGVSWWDLVANNSEQMNIFNEGMASDSQMMSLALRDCNSVFEGIETIVDVGGGNGATGKIISEAYPELQYIVFDLPSVVANLQGIRNLSYVGGDMFKSIPEANAVLLKWVLHNWNDDYCKKILKNCKECILRKGKGGKIIIIEVVINEGQDKYDTTQVKLEFDMTMMAMFSAKERTEKEWKQLFTGSGFNNYKIFPLFGFRSLIELYVI
ncbi:hypothetical protein PIB30_084185 [Stylosanthes scabra]|uniref:Uncharacterized protein n=1 Tax=Stylosanthes scabra TaxID=79078 RepID=A0ABU6WTF3_9FABA|nr:hypothetical protein [Stylosanthes scabra]